MLQSLLQKKGLDLCNMRGQGYDNGSNMKGKDIGVQAQLSDLAIISIEQDVSNALDYSEIVDEFACSKATKTN